jgi:hypothetical protein
LIKAIRDRDQTRAASLLKEGANPNAAIRQGDRELAPLMVALAVGDASKVDELLNAGSDAFVTFGGYSALDVALDLDPDNHPVVLRLLLEVPGTPDSIFWGRFREGGSGDAILNLLLVSCGSSDTRTIPRSSGPSFNLLA